VRILQACGNRFCWLPVRIGDSRSPASLGSPWSKPHEGVSIQPGILSRRGFHYLIEIGKVVSTYRTRVLWVRTAYGTA
jgi:hypothetical protein